MMQVFEFHFNPPKHTGQAKTKTDLIFDSFCYEPENIYERKLGGLYMAGILKNTLPQNIRFLDNLAKVIKEKYYKSVFSPEKSLKETLKEANHFLEQIAKRGDVSWLGNLSFTVITLTPQQKSGGGEFNFTKVGDLKIFLIRNGQVIDVEKSLKLEDIEPYPLKIFGNIVSGKLVENDVILVLTKEVSDYFLKEKLFNSISNLSVFDQKKLKQIFNGKREELSKIFGICLIILLSKETLVKERETISQKKRLIKFSFREVFSPLLKVFKLPKFSLKLKFPQIKFSAPKLKIPKVPKIPKLKFQFPFLRKKINLVLLLIFFLALGFFIFEKVEEKQLRVYREELAQVQEKVSQAESYLIVAKNNPQATKKAHLLLNEAFETISPLSNLASTFPPDFAQDILTLKETISENLSQISKLKIIEAPELIFEFNTKDFIPQKVISFSGNLYFFSPYSENIFEVNQKSEGKILSINKKINSAVSLSDSLLFFSKPNQLINFKDGLFQEQILLETPYPNFNFNSLSSYENNLYFFDSQNGKITKYPYWGNAQWGMPQSWLSLEIKKAFDFRSMAVDGSVWILTKDNSIQKYYAGSLQETLSLEIFPYAKDFTKIFTSSRLPYLYILEPSQKRIIIINKSGQIIEQFQSEKFDNLLDFTVSENAKTIYLLNGLRVYKLLL